MIRVRQIKVPIKKDDKEFILNKLEKVLKTKINDYKIIKKSIDARDKNNILYVYELDVLVNNENEVINRINNKDILLVLIINTYCLRVVRLL